MSHNQAKYSEEELVMLLQQRSDHAFNYLYDNYSAVIYGNISRIISEPETAQDVMQEAFMKIWSNIGQYDKSRGRIYTWIINVAHNTAIDKLRSKGEIMKNKIRGNEDIVNTNVRNIEIATDSIGLKNLVSELKPEQKQIVDMAYFKGFTLDEIAKTTNTPLGTVKTRMRQAIKILREKFTS